MEPLIATSDWLKDFDPLFDLLDDEIGAADASQVSSLAGSPFAHDYLSCADFDYYSSSCSSASSSNHLQQHLHHHHHHHSHGVESTNLKHQDELSLLLGLEWLPCIDVCLLENARTSNNNNNIVHQPPSACSTGLPSPSSAHSCASSPGGAGASATQQHPSTNASSSLSSFSTSSSPRTNHKGSAGYQQHKNASLSQGGPVKPVKPVINLNPFSSKKLALVLSKGHNITSTASNIATTTTTGLMTASKMPNRMTSNNLLVTSPKSAALHKDAVSDLVLSAAAAKRRKKSLKPKGTSLLAQPSPRSNQHQQQIQASATTNHSRHQHRPYSKSTSDHIRLATIRCRLRIEHSYAMQPTHQLSSSS